MDFLHHEVGTEFQRWMDLVGPDDPYAGDDTIGLHEALAAHFLIVDYFTDQKFGIGGVGPRSLDLLHSALSRQFTGYGNVKKWSGLYQNAATLMFGLIMNHPFHDANKRTALLVTLSLLHRKKQIITLPQRKLDGLVVAIAGNQLESYFEKDARHKKKLLSLPKSNNADGVVLLVADFLQRNTRARDNSGRSVTFSELDKALNKHGFALRHPSGNYINVVRVEPAVPGRFLGLGARGEREVYLAQVGFPGWKVQVNQLALKTVRESTGLTTQNGCDTKVLFEGAEPLNSLISEYVEPLKRLANR